MKARLNALLIASALALQFGSVRAVLADTVDFTFLDGSTAIAEGSFTYATGDSGVLNYGDLSAFSITLDGQTYDLAFADSAAYYSYFAYDTSTGSFVGTTTNGYHELLGAINSTFMSGFFFNPPPPDFGEYSEYATNTTGSYTSITYTDISAVPGPIVGAGLPGLIFAGGGLLGWWRRKRTASTFLAPA